MEDLPVERTEGRRLTVSGMGSWVRRMLTGGTLVLVPLVITVLLFRVTFDFLDQLLEPVTIAVFGRHVPGVGLIGLLLLILAIGIASNSRTGSRAGVRVQQVIMSLPVVRTVYGASRRLVEIASGSTADGARRVVLVEYPRPGAFSVGFLMNLATDETGRSMAVVFIPTAPMPNSGFVTIMPAAEVFETDLSVQEAMRLVLSGGSLSPSQFVKRPLTEGQMQRLLDEVAASRAELEAREQEIRLLRELANAAPPSLPSDQPDATT